MSATGQRGTYNLTRELWDHPIFAKEPFTEAQAWAWLIGAASFREKTANIAPVRLSRGELCLGEQHLATRWDWSRSRVHRFLEKLRRAGMIEVRENRTEQRTCRRRGDIPNIIKISNYRRFQDSANKKVNMTIDDSRTTYKEESKNPVRTTPSLRSGVDARASEPALPGFEAEVPKPKPTAPHPIPDDFAPDPAPAIAYWRKRGREDLVHLVDEEAVTFRAHHVKLGSKFKDWPSTWRTWYVGTPEKIRPPPRDFRTGETIMPVDLTTSFTPERLRASAEAAEAKRRAARRERGEPEEFVYEGPSHEIH